MASDNSQTFRKIAYPAILVAITVIGGSLLAAERNATQSLTRQVAEAAGRLDALSERFDQLPPGVAPSTVTELQAQVRDLDEQLMAFADRQYLEPSALTPLRNRLDALSERFDQLPPGVAPSTVTELQAQVRDLDEQLMAFADRQYLEPSALTPLRNRLDALSERFDQLPPGVAPSTVTELQAQVRDLDEQLMAFADRQYLEPSALTPLRNRLDALSERFDQLPPGVAPSTVTELQAQVRDLDEQLMAFADRQYLEPSALTPLRNRLDALSERFDQLPPGVAPSTVTELQAQVRDLDEQLMAFADRQYLEPSALTPLRNRLDALSERFDQLPPGVAPSTVTELQAQVRDLDEQLMAFADRQYLEPSALTPLRNRLDALSERFDQLPPGVAPSTVTELQAQVRDLDEQLMAFADRQYLEPSALTPLRNRLDALSERFDQLPPGVAPSTVTELQAQVRDLDEQLMAFADRQYLEPSALTPLRNRLDALSERFDQLPPGVAPSTVTELQAQVRDLDEQLMAFADRQYLEPSALTPLRNRLDALSERFDQLPPGVAPSTVTELQAQVRDLDEQLMAFADRQYLEPSALTPLRNRLDALSERFDQLPPGVAPSTVTELQAQVRDLDEQLMAFADRQYLEPSALTPLRNRLDALSERFDQLPPGVAPSTVTELQAQVRDLDERQLANTQKLNSVQIQLIASERPGADSPTRSPRLLGRILFETDSAAIKDPQYSRLENMILPIANTILSIDLVGHTDRQGTPEYNFALSLRRVASIRAALITLGFGDDQIKSLDWMGEVGPPIATADGIAEAQNRSVSIYIYELDE